MSPGEADVASDTQFAVSATPIEISVLGPVSATVGDVAVSLGGEKQKTVLAVLAASAGHVVDADVVTQAVYGEDAPERARRTVQTYVSNLRGILGDTIVRRGPGWLLDVDRHDVDAARFEDLVAGARSLPSGQASRRLSDALDLWRGDAYVDVEAHGHLDGEITRLGELRMGAIEARLDADLGLGRAEQLVGEIAALIAEHPYREGLRARHMLALYRSGRQQEALRSFEELRAVLLDMGLDPSPELHRLEQRILEQDASLLHAEEADGQALRGYRLLEEIGSGAFSVVWRGVQPSVDREVAIKQIRAELASQPDFIRRFETEAQLVARIEHPHVVPLIDYWRDPESAYLVMRWLRGGTVEQSLNSGRWSVERTLDMVRQIGAALAAAHDRGVIHRDVKTANILLDEDDNAFLADFGIASEALASAGPDASLSHGSPAYAAPEQLRREPLGPGADIFSLGVVVYECLTAELPFPDVRNAAEMMRRQLGDPRPDVRTVRPDVPDNVAEAIARATAKEPWARFTTVLDFVDALGSDESDPAAAGKPADRPRVLFTNPYMGLRAFDESDAALFFGRNRLVAELIAQLSGHGLPSRALTVVGPSGSGKSSVVRAGLLPAIQRGEVEGSAEWFVTAMTPGAHPYEALEAALLRIAVNPPATLVHQLRDGLRGVLRGVRRCLRSDDDRVLLVIDQLEELFTSAPADVGDRFLEALATAVEDPSTPLRVVATLRADYYDRPLNHPAFAQVLKAGAVDVTPLAPDELEETITGPAHRHGVELEAGLVTRLAAEAVGQAAPLPLLQYTLAELYRERDGRFLTLGAFDRLGGVSGAIAARAEDLFRESSETEQTAARRVFGRLIRPEQATTDLRRRALVADLGDDDATGNVLARYGAGRLLTFDRDVLTREPTVEVAHEALLREWPRLRQWLVEDRELLGTVDRLAGAADAWDDGGRSAADLYRGGRLETATEVMMDSPDRLRRLDREFVAASRAQADQERHAEQQRLRRLRRLVTAIGATLVVALAAGVVAFWQRNQAQDAARDAEVATLIGRAGLLSDDDAELAVLLSLEAHRRDPGLTTEQSVLDSLGSAPSAIKLLSLDRPTLEGAPRNDCGWFLQQDVENQFWVTGDTLVSQSLRTGEVSARGPAPDGDPCVGWVQDEGLGRRLAISQDLMTIWFAPPSGGWDTKVEFDHPTFWPFEASFNPEHRLLLKSEREDHDVLVVVDDRTGQDSGIEIVGSEPRLGPAATSPSGRVGAAGFGVDVPNRPGEVIVFDTLSGDELHRIATSTRPSVFVFDEPSSELIVGFDDGTIGTVDIDAGRIVQRVDAGLDGDLIVTLAIQPDGSLLASSPTGVARVDRTSGAIGLATDFGRPEAVLVSGDGRVLVAEPDFSRAIFSIGHPLVVSAIAFEGPLFGSFGPGQVALTADDRPAELIDLATGQRRLLELDAPESVPFDAVVVTPGPNGALALSETGEAVVWRDGVITDRVDLTGGQARFLSDGHNTGDHHVLIIQHRDQSARAYSMMIEDGHVRLLYDVDARSGSIPIADGDGSIHLLDRDGTLHSYSQTGAPEGDLEVGRRFLGRSRARSGTDPLSGRIAVGADDWVLIVDPDNGEVTEVETFGEPVNLQFAREGEVLIVGTSDGTLRLWNIEDGVAAAVLWRGDGFEAGSWYDAERDTVWVVTPDQLLEMSIDPGVVLDRACRAIDRDLTPEEWARYVPGGGEPRSACT